MKCRLCAHQAPEVELKFCSNREKIVELKFTDRKVLETIILHALWLLLISLNILSIELLNLQ